MTTTATVFIPKTQPAKSVSARALAQVGGIIDTPLTNAVDLMRVTRSGISPDAVDALLKRGFARSDVVWIVPPRTLSHRRKNQEQLTSEESGRWLRAAKIQALAEVILGDGDKAMQWLHKPRKAFDQLSAMEVMQTEAGGQLVEELLGQLDAGFFA
ncbi:MAG: antitoxin Xre/MbcA/ParS toxin-binding domain-containing protein [Pseudomonadales bacterium]